MGWLIIQIGNSILIPNCIEKNPSKTPLNYCFISSHSSDLACIAIGAIFFWKKNCIWFDNENIIAKTFLQLVVKTAS